MKWPPIKSWTSKEEIDGFIHFVAINYGGKNNERWIILVSVLDGNIRLKVSWGEIKDTSKWIQGWTEINNSENFKSSTTKIPRLINEKNYFSGCLHPSEDSGLIIPTTVKSTRAWK
tara:strand:- start:54 stop:401 length:348 start_codon:yes stop_codon:yes gene_type:complete